MRSLTQALLPLLMVFFVAAATSVAAAQDKAAGEIPPVVAAEPAVPVPQEPIAPPAVELPEPLVEPPVAPPAKSPARTTVPKVNLQIPDAMQSCAANLRKVYAAIKKYEKDKGKLPGWLSDLVPDYLAKEALLCPGHRAPKAYACPDPKLPCSYSYQFSSTPAPSQFGPVGGMPYGEWKAHQLKLFGNVVPMARCAHGTRRVNVSAGGQVYWSYGGWEAMFMPGYRRGDELDPRSSTTQPRKPVVERPVSIYTLPSGPAAGNAEELLKFIENLRDFRPRTEWEAAQHQSRARGAMMLAARQILRIEKDEWSKPFQTALLVLLEDRVRVMAQASPALQQRTLDQVKTFLTAKSEKGLQPQDADLALSAATALESGGNIELATQAYGDFAKLVAQSKDEKLSGMAEMLEGAVRRLDLSGKQLKLEGAKMDGSQFDWSAYRGKVVLVWFWASDSQPCRAELPGVKLNYQLYHDRGLEVVGISTDSDRQALEKFLRKEEIPWVTLHQKDPEARHPTVAYYGVTDVPTALLVDKEGKVVSPRARGGELDKLLEKLIGPPYVPKGKLTCIDLQPKANRGLAERLGNIPDNNLKELPQGEQTFAGMKFRVGERLMQLTGTNLRDRPEAIEGIQVNRAVTALFIFHGTAWNPVDGTVIGQYKINYEGGARETIPIVYGEDVRNWVSRPDPKPASRGKVAWVGTNAYERRLGGTIRIYLSAWKNPHPDNKVVTIDYVSTNTAASPFCVAITAEAAGSPETDQ